MGTNYYLVGGSTGITDGHIGKQSAGHGFTWDMAPDEVESLCGSNGECSMCSQRIAKGICDEYGRQFTWEEFLSKITPKDIWNYEMIGRCFS